MNKLKQYIRKQEKYLKNTLQVKSQDQPESFLKYKNGEN